MALVLVTAAADAQPRSPGAVDPSRIRIQSDGNELVALRSAPVAYTTLEHLVADIGRAGASRAAPIRVVRASPPQTIDYLLCVTNAGTLVVGERIHTFDERQRRYVFSRGEIARSYPPLEESGAWRWLFDVPLSRETTVSFDLRARPRWPVEVVTVTASRLP